MRLMRIVHLVRYGSIKGGAETYVAQLCAGLRDQGHEVSLVYALEPDRSRTEVRDGIHFPGLVDGTGNAEALKAALEKVAPDVIHAHMFDEPWITQACIATAPTLVAVHDHRLDCPVGTRYLTGWQKTCTVKPGLKCLGYNVVAHCGSLRANVTLQPYRSWRRINREAKRNQIPLQVFSEHMADELEAAVGRRPFVTPYPTPSRERRARPTRGYADDLLLAPEVREGSAAKSRVEADRRPIVVAMGRLNREKGFRQLLDAMSAMTVPCHLVVIGDGHDRDALDRQASQTIGGHRITFTGWLDSSSRDRWLDRSRLVVVPSMWPEPFGIVGLEAMAASKPVVAFDSGGIRQWLQDGVNGTLVAHGSARRLAQAMVDLLEDPKRASAMGAEGRRLSEERFALAQHVDRVIELYRGISSR